MDKLNKMNAKTLKEFKQKVRKLSDLYNSLITLWNGELQFGDNATYPVTIIVGVILHNIAFDGSNCSGYSHEREVEKVEKNIKTLKLINEYENGTYMTHFPYIEVETLYSGLSMSEEME